jgi:hypothetical protein
LNQDYAGYPVTPKDYPNVKFQHLVDMAGSDFMFMTYDNNIEILENIPAEKSLYKFEMLKRDFYVMADYKLGIRFVHIGTTLEPGDPLAFQVQTVWSNTAPVFKKDFFAPIHDDETGKVKVNFRNLYVTKGWNTDIAEFKNTTPGTVIKIKGDVTLATVKNVLDNTAISLVGNVPFDLKSGGTLTLFVLPNGTVQEIGRTGAPAVVTVLPINFSGSTVDADQGVDFTFSGATTTAVTTVTKGVEGKSIKIFGTDAAGIDVTLATNQTIILTAPATLGDSNDFVQLTLVDGKWLETNRSIT